MASITAPESMMAPSTIASGGRGSMPMLTSWYSAPPLPPAFSSTALIAEEPMSSPTSPFFFPNRAHESPLSAQSRLLRSTAASTEPSEVRLTQKLKCCVKLT